MTSTIIYAVIVVVGASFYLITRRMKQPEGLALVYTAVMTAAVLALLAYLVYGALSTSGNRQGGYIGESIIIGCFAAGMLFGTARLAKLVRQRRRERAATPDDPVGSPAP